MSIDEMADAFKKYGIKAPGTGNELTHPAGMLNTIFAFCCFDTVC